ncbi:MAG TPA: tetratricopeptide repeat protein, partial [Phycisphaerae bacterium]|nr:tetratricopeptide repeat protein [Phycisphaerae bacterium]
LVKDSMLVHDSFAQEYSDKVRPFPMERENFRFVGERFDENQEHNNNDRNALIAESARRGSNNPQGKPYVWEEQTGQMTTEDDRKKEEKLSPQPHDTAAKFIHDGKQETPAPVDPDIQRKFRQALQDQQAGRFAESEAIYRQILSQKPDHSGSIHQLGLLAVQTGRLEDALRLFKEAVAADPKVALYHSNLGNVLASLKQPEEAIMAYRESIKLKPDYAMAYNNMGSILETQGHLGQAIEALQKAVDLKPDYAEAHGNLGNALESQGRVAAAIDEYRMALKISPQFAAVHSNLIYAMHFDPDYDPKAVEQESRQWDQRHAQPLKKFIAPYANNHNTDRRLKIGYLSPDFRQHSVGYFIENVLAVHDRTAVEVYCYADVVVPDQTTRRMEGYLEANHWQRITALSNQQVAQMIRRDQIDILIDLSGHTARNRLMIFALKPAPVQVSYLGYPGRTGVSSIDYHFTDIYADPVEDADSREQQDSENLVRLQPTFLCYRPPDDAPPVGPLPAWKAGHVTFGCFNNWRKINPRLIALWSRILQRTPESRLVVKSRALRDQTARHNLMELCASGGISPDRLELKEKIPSTADHLELYNSIDIALDTFPYNGTTTTCEALWMGAPVVTLAGHAHMSRVGLSILTNVGLSDLIARTP